MYRDEVEVNAARPGENLRLRLQGIEEEDISAGGRRVCVGACAWLLGSVYWADEHMQAGSALHCSNLHPPAGLPLPCPLQALCCATASAWCPR